MLHVFIINSFSGYGYSSDYIREELKKKENLNCLVFNSEYAGHEAVIAQQIYGFFPDERIRFYICGGSGTFRNVIQNLYESSRVEFAEIPFGINNDFLHVFGNESHKFLNLDSMIKGQHIACDLIKSEECIAHNAISAGYDALAGRFVHRIKYSKSLGKITNHIVGIFAAMLPNSIRANVTFNGKTYNGKFSEIVVAKGCKLGGMMNITNSAKLNDGLVTVALLKHRNKLAFFRAIIAMAKGDADRVNKYWIIEKTDSVRITCQKAINFSADGELLKTDVMDISVEKGRIKYIVPEDLGGLY